MKMKRLLVTVILVLPCLVAGAYGRSGHATVTAIAEAHLTDKAKAMIAEYFHGDPITMHATWADDFASEYICDFEKEAGVPGLKCEPGPYPHCYYIGEDMKAMRSGQTAHYHSDAVYYVNKAIQELKAGGASMPDDLRWKKLAYVIHIIGDLHNVGHARYLAHADNPKYKYAGYNVIWNGSKVKLHRLLDHEFFELFYPFGPYENAKLLDNCTDEEIAKICVGDVYDWATEVAAMSHHIIDTLNPYDYVKDTYIKADSPDENVKMHACDHRKLIATLIRNAGYRLAAVLNSIAE